MPSAVPKSSPRDEGSQNQTSTNALMIIEKKIRNLDKRKKKLDGLKSKRAQGEKLDADQMESLGHFEEVISLRDCLKDTYMQIQGLYAEGERTARKAAKRQQLERQQEEVARIRELLLVQDVLQQLGDSKLRQELLQTDAGQDSNSPVVSQQQFDDIDQLFKVVSPDRVESGDGFLAALDTAAEHYQALLDARDKQVPETSSSYATLRSILTSVSGSQQLARRLAAAGEEEEDDEEAEPQPESQQQQEAENGLAEDFEQVSLGDVPAADSLEVQSALPSVLPPAPVPQLQQPEAAESRAEPPAQLQQPALAFRDSGAEAAVPREFKEIVSSVQGQFTFLQDSLIASPAPVAPTHPAAAQLPQKPAEDRLQFGTAPLAPADPSAAPTGFEPPPTPEQIPFDAPVATPSQPHMSEDAAYQGSAAFGSEFSNYSSYSSQPPAFEQAVPMTGLNAGLGQFAQGAPPLPNPELAPSADESKFPNPSAQSFEPSTGAYDQDFQQVNYRSSGGRTSRGGPGGRQQHGFGSGGPGSSRGQQRGGMYGGRDGRTQQSYSSGKPRNQGYGGQGGGMQGSYSGPRSGSDYSMNGGYSGPGSYRRGGSRGGMGGGSRGGARAPRGGYQQQGGSGGKF